MNWGEVARGLVEREWPATTCERVLRIDSAPDENPELDGMWFNPRLLAEALMEVASLKRLEINPADYAEIKRRLT